MTPQEAQAARAKFSIQAGVHHIGETLESFTSAARTAIWTHSEIDLRPQEIVKIARSLVDVVTNKSCARIGMLFSRSAKTGQALASWSAFALSPRPCPKGQERQPLRLPTVDRSRAQGSAGDSRRACQKFATNRV